MAAVDKYADVLVAVLSAGGVDDCSCPSGTQERVPGC